MPSKDLAQKIYAAVRLIPRGKVASYSQVAALVGNCNLRRYVGNALHKNPSNSVTPCHRVVNARGFCSGSFAFGGSGVQRQKLEAEGVTFIKGHVDMERHAISQDDFDAMSARLQEITAKSSRGRALVRSESFLALACVPCWLGWAWSSFVFWEF